MLDLVEHEFQLKLQLYITLIPTLNRYKYFAPSSWHFPVTSGYHQYK